MSLNNSIDHISIIKEILWKERLSIRLVLIQNVLYSKDIGIIFLSKLIINQGTLIIDNKVEGLLFNCMLFDVLNGNYLIELIHLLVKFKQ
jgi:hypothetical protein